MGDISTASLEGTVSNEAALLHVRTSCGEDEFFHMDDETHS